MSTPTPPVNEVVLSVAVEPQDLLEGPHLHHVLGHWFDELPDIAVQPPYAMPVESPFPGIGGMPFVFGLGMTPPTRYWLSSPEQPYLVQVQRDYLALNWRRGPSKDDYVTYEVLRARFEDFLDGVRSRLADRGRRLAVQRAELTYVNLIEPNNVWQELAQLPELLALNLPDLGTADAVSFATSRSLLDGGSWIGRLHVQLQSGYDLAKNTPVLSLNLTGRSGGLAGNEVSACLAFLDRAHTELNATFLRLIRPAAREHWGLHDERHRG